MFQNVLYGFFKWKLKAFSFLRFVNVQKQTKKKKNIKICVLGIEPVPSTK